MSITAVLIFILFLTPLVFFHELGHFLFARLFGVRVETFSIGFGPKLLKFKMSDTEYAFSAIPLGGYVKMFGDDPLNKESIPEDQRKYSFTFKGKWARFWIVFGGPLANFLLAMALFFFLSVNGEKIPEIKLGPVLKTHKLASFGFNTGDILYKVNDREIKNPTDLLGDEVNNVNTVTVIRRGAEVVLPVNLGGKKFFEAIVEVPPLLLKPILISSEGKTLKLSDGFQGEEVVSSLEEILTAPNKNFIDLFQDDQRKREGVSFQTTELETRKQELVALGLYPKDLVVEKVVDNSAAFKAGIKSNDIVTQVDGIVLTSFMQMRDLIQQSKGESVEVKLISEGKKVTKKLTPELDKINGKVVKKIGVYSAGEYVRPKFVMTKPESFGAALSSGFQRTIVAIQKTIDGFYMLISGQASLKQIGGPVTIGKLANDSFEISITYFLQLMALFSVNLGIINLLPIPILDGGHILFIFLEILNRGPISRRKMEIAQQVGLSIVLLLMFGAIFNDFTR
ncbi:MAG: RIP metalloprotease RseP [Bacteriovoracaceae bacterium]